MPAKEPVRPRPPQEPGARKERVVDLLCQALEAELGCSKVYGAAIRSAQNEGLRNEWTEALSRARDRARVLGEALAELGADATSETPGREAVRQTQRFLSATIEASRQDAALSSAQLTCAECVVLAETKAHASWQLIRVLAKALTGERGAVLAAACGRDESRLESMGGTAPWVHELWLQAMGLPATLPPAPAAQSIGVAASTSRRLAARKKDVKEQEEGTRAARSR